MPKCTKKEIKFNLKFSHQLFDLMKKYFKNIYNEPKHAKIFEWGKLLTLTGGAQILVQGIGFISGILIIRLLPTSEYALYTLANTMLATLILLADGGIATGVMAEGGKVWRDPVKFGEVIHTGIILRRKFAIVALIISIPVFIWLLNRQDISWLMIILLTLSIIPAFSSALSSSLLQIAPKLHQNIPALQKNQVEINVLRLILNVAVLFVFPWAFIAVLSNGLPQIWGNIKLSKITNKYIGISNETSPTVQKSILKVVVRTLPGSIYYCLMGQITIFLLSIFGTTESIAQVGAIGKLTVLLGIIGAFMSTIFEPRFARLSTNKKKILNKFFQIQLLLIMLSIFIVSITYFFPDQIIFILGDKYKGLGIELMLMTIASCLAMISGSAYSLSAGRGVIPNPLVVIPILILIQIMFFLTIDYTEIIGILWFSIFTYVASWLIRIIYFLNYLNKLEN